eukprot:3936031-Rhodomonas_salina.2
MHTDGQSLRSRWTQRFEWRRWREELVMASSGEPCAIQSDLLLKLLSKRAVSSRAGNCSIIQGWIKDSRVKLSMQAARRSTTSSLARTASWAEASSTIDQPAPLDLGPEQE